MGYRRNKYAKEKKGGKKANPELGRKPLPLMHKQWKQEMEMDLGAFYVEKQQSRGEDDAS